MAILNTGRGTIENNAGLRDTSYVHIYRCKHVNKGVSETPEAPDSSGESVVIRKPTQQQWNQYYRCSLPYQWMKNCSSSLYNKRSKDSHTAKGQIHRLMKVHIYRCKMTPPKRRFKRCNIHVAKRTPITVCTHVVF